MRTLLMAERSHQKHRFRDSRSVACTRVLGNRFVGREAELAHLDEAWEASLRNERNRPQIVTLVSPGGIGKTTLVAHWAQQLAHRQRTGDADLFAWSFYDDGGSI